MMSQREADLAVLMSVYSRSEGRDSGSKLYRIRNSLTAGAYLTTAQFDTAINKLRDLQMIELEGSNDESTLRISDHGGTWLMSNFHRVRDERATLRAKNDDWVMTPPNKPTFRANDNS
jgi:hypothetical protein